MLLFVLNTALASWGTVEQVTTPSAAGTWAATQETRDAVRVRDGSETPMVAGMVLEVGDIVRTTQARVAIAVSSRETVTLTEGTELTLQERGVVQRLGEVYYRLRGAFSIQYGHVEATVEGTQFLIDAEEPFIVVSEGSVRISHEQSDALLARRDTLESPAGELGTPMRWGPFAVGNRLQRSWPLGDAQFLIAATAMGGFGQGPIEFGHSYGPSPFEGLRISGRYRPVSRLWLEASTGIAASGIRAVRVPVNLGASWDLGLVEAGAEVVAQFQLGRPQFGANAIGRVRLPIDRSLFFETHARAGYVGAIYVEAGAGVAVGF